MAHCALGWNMTETAPSIFLCDNGALVDASLPTCTPLPCTFALPNALGVTHDCDGNRTAETCSATCGVAARPFSGGRRSVEAGFQYAAGVAAATFTCQPSGSFSGTSPNCCLAVFQAPFRLRRTHPMPRPPARDQLFPQLPRRGSPGSWRMELVCARPQLPGQLRGCLCCRQ